MATILSRISPPNQLNATEFHSWLFLTRTDNRPDPISRPMTAETNNLFVRRFANQLQDLLRVTDEAVRFLELRGISSRAVNLAHLTIEEVATNILKYGY